MGLAGQRVVVVGLARSGVAAAEYLARAGARVVATDSKGTGELAPEAMKLSGMGIELQAGGHRRESFTSADMVVVSPGVPWDQPDLQAARAAGVEVIAELELGARAITGPMAAITGTKGKSTTTAALGAMLAAGGGDVRVGGNIGLPLCSLLEGATAATRWVLEVSSFQLEGTVHFHPRLSVFLNLAADHLDRHASFEEYAAAKARIFANQDAADWAVVNADDPLVMEQARASRARRLPFSVQPPAAGDGAFLQDGQARLRRDGATETLFALDEVKVPGAHLALDLLVAGASARLLGASAEEVRGAVRAFRGIEHVLERVEEIAGVAFYNDTKATNVEAARRSIESFTTPVIVILGGHYKGGDFGELAAPLRVHGRAVMAIGEAAARVEQALSSTLPVVRSPTLEAAVEGAFARARPGDTVLLAPACSSFDMFRDYAARGQAFKQAVRALAARRGNRG